ncbi:MAG: hydroxymethylbilane synthase [Thermodesulfobacteriota bacterium]
MSKTVRIATRGSKLALWQAEWVASEIEKRYEGTKVELLKIKTTGDKITDVPLAQVGGKGLFTKEIEEALLRGDAELAVHSMKDVPTFFPEGLHLRCITKREDPRDALISKDGTCLMDLPEGAVIGTSSLRRRAQLLSVRPDLKTEDLRGNVDTRLRKVKDGEYDAIILAGAGLKRLGWADRITEYINPAVMLPAIGQGALGIETRIDDTDTNELVSFFDNTDTSVAVRGERALLAKLEGGCQVPIAAYGTVAGGRLKLTGLVASTDGKRVVSDVIEGSIGNAEELGVALAVILLKSGAHEILSELYDIAPQAD